MCKFCDNNECTITKAQVIERGAIIENNARGIMRLGDENSPQTYSFDGVPAYDSLSALIPVENDENPHVYTRFIYDEDEDCSKDWEDAEIQNPLNWQTETEFLEKLK